METVLGEAARPEPFLPALPVWLLLLIFSHNGPLSPLCPHPPPLPELAKCLLSSTSHIYSPSRLRGFSDVLYHVLPLAQILLINHLLLYIALTVLWV